MWPLWLTLLLLGRSVDARCLVVDQLEARRALVTDGGRVAVVEAGRNWSEGDRLCGPRAAARVRPAVNRHRPAPVSRRPGVPGETDAR